MAAVLDRKPEFFVSGLLIAVAVKAAQFVCVLWLT